MKIKTKIIIIFSSIVFNTPIFALTFLCGVRISSGASFSNLIQADNSELWNDSIVHSNHFFITHGWDANSGSFASELTVDGSRLNEKRYLIASSRMVYGLAHGSEVVGNYLDYAIQEAKFILKHMTSRDQNGPYFLSAVNKAGCYVKIKLS